MLGYRTEIHKEEHMKKSRKGRRKLLGVLTAVCMAAVMIPAAAFADDVEDLEGGDGSTV